MSRPGPSPVTPPTSPTGARTHGGWLTSQYALRFPDRLAKIVLLAPAGVVLPLRLEWIARAILCAMPHPYFTRSFMHWLLEDLSHRDDASRKMIDEWAGDAYLALRSFESRPMVHPTVLQDFELQKLRMPTLYLVGEHEKIYSAEKAVGRLRATAPQIDAVVIPNAGHDLTLVQAELVNRKILEFAGKP